MSIHSDLSFLYVPLLLVCSCFRDDSHDYAHLSRYQEMGHRMFD